MNQAFWKGKRVLLTGHTGFKGGWLSSWLISLGSNVYGFALPPDTKPSFFRLTGLERHLHSKLGDIRDRQTLSRAVSTAKPEIIFHLAAQPLVRKSYAAPAETFDTNVMGTVNLLEAARTESSVKSVIVVTSDKCYAENVGDSHHKETDLLGGRDPYSASKACAEHIAASYRTSFLVNRSRPIGLATVRAGNVIGGGDYAEDRIIPDAVRGIATGRTILIRNPSAVRPWQHVLEPLWGYLMLAENVYRAPLEWSEAWNFGPARGRGFTVSQLIHLFLGAFGKGRSVAQKRSTGPYESPMLRLNSDKAKSRLGWRTVLPIKDSIEWSAKWYLAAGLKPKPSAMLSMTFRQIADYERRAELAEVNKIP